MSQIDKIALLENDLASLQEEVKLLQAWANIPKNSPFAVFQVGIDGNIIVANYAGNKVLEKWRKALKRPIEDYFKVLKQRYKHQTQPWELKVYPANEPCQILVTPNASQDTYDVYVRQYIKEYDNKLQIKVAHNRLEALIKNMQTAIMVVDEHGIIVVVNEDFCKIFFNSAPVADLIGKVCNDTLVECQHLFLDLESTTNTIIQLATERVACEGILIEMVENRIIELSYYPITIGNKSAGEMWKYKDVTEQEIQRKALARNEEKFRNLIENMNLGLMEVDNSDKIMYANLSFQRMMGYSQDELIGSTAFDLFVDKEQEYIIQEKVSLRQSGVIDVYEIHCKKKDGSIIWLMISGAPIFNETGEIIGSIGIHLDITKRKLLETELERARLAAEENSRTRELFMATMSHEIRTPMNAIIGMQKLLKKTRIDEKQSKYIDAIGISSSNLLNLLNDVLDFTKIHAGKIQLNSAAFNLRNIIASIANMLEFKADEKGIALNIEIDDDVPQLVIGDYTRLYQILINIMGNAIKFTDHGHVKLIVRKVNNAQLFFCIKDTGIGMSEETRNKAFDAFVQASSSLPNQYGGSGLGLSISKELVELMGGKIEVESELGLGSTFWFTIELPNGNVEESTIDLQVEPSYRLDGKLILVVEDNDINRLLIHTVLEFYGALVSLANNGLEAVQSVKERLPDAILMDLQMPIMGGHESSQIIRKNGYKGPIFALTANISAEDKAKCLEMGMNQLLTKPFDELALIKEICHWIKVLPIA